MRTYALPFLIALVSSGSAFASQPADPSDNQVSNLQTSEDIYQIIQEDNSKRAPEKTANAVEGDSKSLQERERERKGLPRYWNG
ncbi:hypothetical protein [Stutzerimonas zhaodongensis]|uniref:hypothetical protein n=1 Tax=Stutzerimonas zhaodongensis TaxID=1176257 RepID=UPI0011C45BF2|nr:hypothetical protein [Stutzerimonas zhaodongensis]MCQ4316263.1 hypothetical protein [Stutzerimonas zhaodongensis]